MPVRELQALAQTLDHAPRPTTLQAGDPGSAQRLPARLRLPGEVLHAHRLDSLPAGKPGAGRQLAGHLAAGSACHHPEECHPQVSSAAPVQSAVAMSHMLLHPGSTSSKSPGVHPPLPLQYCQARGRRLTFEEWMAARPDICQARDFIHQNPATALAPLPLVLPLTPAPSLLPTPVPSGRCAALAAAVHDLLRSGSAAACATCEPRRRGCWPSGHNSAAQERAPVRGGRRAASACHEALQQ